MKHSVFPSAGAGSACLLALFALAGSAPAAELYSTGFENPPFVAGSQLPGQDGWAVIPPFLNPSAAVITSAEAATGSQSLLVRGSDMTPAPEVDPYAVVGSYRRPVNYDAGAGLTTVLITSDVMLEGAPLGTGDFFTANIAARSADGAVGELSISSDGRVYGFTGTGADGLTLINEPISLNEWHNLGISVDFAANTYSFLVDGTDYGTFPFEAGFTSDVLLRGSLVVYGRPDAGAYSRDNFTARYDNFSIATVPEPGSLSCLLPAAAACLLKRRRRG
ncbi:MAG: hypothetical protein EOP86_18755 [Verrucomicrobiaceae bacterium]|nr:MAG: hypothetical protein EOP86_18755 [Verrucomicrobiaceae bacterium]